jgi:glycosyltransferase involved in cell wall biosynthesis
LGNVSVEKGINEVLLVGRRLAAVGAGVPVLVAGPFSSSSAEMAVAESTGICKEIRYVGPRYDADKTRFLQSIDALLFPSQYVHEAEPLTVYEALAQGVPVIALQRGCLTEVMKDAGGLLIESPDRFVEEAVRQILLWQAHPHLFEEASQHALDCFSTLAHRYNGPFEELLDMIRG